MASPHTGPLSLQYRRMKLALRTRDFDSRARAELNARAFLVWLDLFLSGHNCPLPYFVPLTGQSISHVPCTLPDRWRSLTLRYQAVMP